MQRFHLLQYYSGSMPLNPVMSMTLSGFSVVFQGFFPHAELSLSPIAFGLLFSHLGGDTLVSYANIFFISEAVPGYSNPKHSFPRSLFQRSVPSPFPQWASA